MFQIHKSTQASDTVSNLLHAVLAIPFGLLVTMGITLHMVMLFA